MGNNKIIIIIHINLLLLLGSIIIDTVQCNVYVQAIVKKIMQ